MSKDAKIYTHPKHSHELTCSNNQSGWECKGKNLKEGCKRDLQGYFQTFDIKCFECKLCNWSICDLCFLSYRVTFCIF